jgi:hypothetical protein
VKWIIAALLSLFLVSPVNAQLSIPDAPVTKKVFLIIFNPLIETGSSQVRLNQYLGWSDPQGITNNVISGFPSVSHNLISYTIQETQLVDDYPVKSDGFKYTDSSYLNCVNNNSTCHDPDISNYQLIFSTYNICAKNVDEVWMWGGPWFGFHEFIHANFCGKTQFVMGFNYERGSGETWHDFGHRMEFVNIARIGGGNWAQDEANEWNKFSKIAGHCGNIHYPPGTIIGQEEYIYDKNTNITSDCDGYLNFPTGPFPNQSLNCSAWGCNQEGYVRWWLNHIPSAPGMTTSFNKTIYNNWWKYYAYWDETVPTPVPSPTPYLGIFSNLFSDFSATSATFKFDYSGSQTYFQINISTTPNLVSDVYFGFSGGQASPIVELSPSKWDKYQCGRTLYWNIVSQSGAQSPNQATTIYCVAATTTELKNTLNNFKQSPNTLDGYSDGKINSLDASLITSRL